MTCYIIDIIKNDSPSMIINVYPLKSCPVNRYIINVVFAINCIVVRLSVVSGL